MFLSSFGNEVKAQEGVYYFACAKVCEYEGTDNLYKNYTGHYLITPVLFISANECSRISKAGFIDSRFEVGISNQFHDYMEAEYSLSYEWDARAYGTYSFSKPDAVE